ncbi:unnamed protein product [Amoebophrya sp. A120]|nr:unnamed protein product [Amoebophrya sp. A120]|eukprot:GSA120T00020362001.1
MPATGRKMKIPRPLYSHLRATLVIAAGGSVFVEGVAAEQPNIFSALFGGSSAVAASKPPAAQAPAVAPSEKLASVDVGEKQEAKHDDVAKAAAAAVRPAPAPFDDAKNKIAKAAPAAAQDEQSVAAMKKKMTSSTTADGQDIKPLTTASGPAAVVDAPVVRAAGAAVTEHRAEGSSGSAEILDAASSSSTKAATAENKTVRSSAKAATAAASSTLDPQQILKTANEDLEKAKKELDSVEKQITAAVPTERQALQQAKQAEKTALQSIHSELKNAKQQAQAMKKNAVKVAERVEKEAAKEIAAERKVLEREVLGKNKTNLSMPPIGMMPALQVGMEKAESEGKLGSGAGVSKGLETTGRVGKGKGSSSALSAVAKTENNKASLELLEKKGMNDAASKAKEGEESASVFSHIPDFVKHFIPQNVLAKMQAKEQEQLRAVRNPVGVEKQKEKTEGEQKQKEKTKSESEHKSAAAGGSGAVLVAQRQQRSDTARSSEKADSKATASAGAKNLLKLGTTSKQEQSHVDEDEVVHKTSTGTTNGVVSLESTTQTAAAKELDLSEVLSSTNTAPKLPETAERWAEGTQEVMERRLESTRDRTERQAEHLERTAEEKAERSAESVEDKAEKVEQDIEESTEMKLDALEKTKQKLQEQIEQLQKKIASVGTTKPDDFSSGTKRTKAAVVPAAEEEMASKLMLLATVAAAPPPAQSPALTSASTEIAVEEHQRGRREKDDQAAANKEKVALAKRVATKVVKQAKNTVGDSVTNVLNSEASMPAFVSGKLASVVPGMGKLKTEPAGMPALVADVLDKVGLSPAEKMVSGGVLGRNGKSGFVPGNPKPLDGSIDSENAKNAFFTVPDPNGGKLAQHLHLAQAPPTLPAPATVTSIPTPAVQVDNDEKEQKENQKIAEKVKDTADKILQGLGLGPVIDAGEKAVKKLSKGEEATNSIEKQANKVKAEAREQNAKAAALEQQIAELQKQQSAGAAPAGGGGPASTIALVAVPELANQNLAGEKKTTPAAQAEQGAQKLQQQTLDQVTGVLSTATSIPSQIFNKGVSSGLPGVITAGADAITKAQTQQKGFEKDHLAHAQDLLAKAKARVAAAEEKLKALEQGQGASPAAVPAAGATASSSTSGSSGGLFGGIFGGGGGPRSNLQQQPAATTSSAGAGGTAKPAAPGASGAAAVQLFELNGFIPPQVTSFVPQGILERVDGREGDGVGGIRSSAHTAAVALVSMLFSFFLVTAFLSLRAGMRNQADEGHFLDDADGAAKEDHFYQAF